MPKGELYINDKDAYTEWGISMSDTALSALLTPPALKAFPENNNRLQHGKQVAVVNPRWESRDLTLTFNLTASSEREFFDRYARFCDEVLSKGKLFIRTRYQLLTQYACLYVSCQQFTQFSRGMAMFVLKLMEPNPDLHYDRPIVNPLAEEE